LTLKTLCSDILDGIGLGDSFPLLIFTPQIDLTLLGGHQGVEVQALLVFGDAEAAVGSEIARTVAIAVTKDGSTSYKHCIKLCGDLGTASFFLQETIFVRDFAGRVRFENTIFQSAVQEDLGVNEERDHHCISTPGNRHEIVSRRFYSW